jgi:cellulose synthase/poly-beta-1,6-N-acetylglucosamine synthase-like glycosyltransferase
MLSYLLPAVYLLLALYALLIMLFYKGWGRYKPLMKVSSGNKAEVSVVIVCRNEATRLPALIQALLAQTDSDFELVWVNDHSEDETLQLMHESASSLKRVSVIDADVRGKKLSQALGIRAATGKLIVTTDADCIPASGWVQTIREFYAVYQPELIIGPVKLYAGQTFFQHLQQLEFATLSASAMGAAGSNSPFMCNAANLAFSKEAWLQSQHELKHELASGDDVFLLHSIKRRKGRIEMLKSVEAMVLTSGSKTLKSFFRQRTRWLAKSRYYSDAQTILISSVVGIVNLTMALGFFAALISGLGWIPLLLLYLGKTLADALFLRRVLPFFGIEFNPGLVLILSFAYPFYVLLTTASALFRNKQTW